MPLEKIALTTLLTIAYHFAPTFQIFYVAEPSFKIREIAINYKDLRITFNFFLFTKNIVRTLAFLKAKPTFTEEKI